VPSLKAGTGTTRFVCFLQVPPMPWTWSFATQTEEEQEHTLYPTAGLNLRIVFDNFGALIILLFSVIGLRK
jgi:hypothetical protein